MKSSTAMTDQSFCNTTVSSTTCKHSRGRYSVTVNENCINGVEHAEFTDDDDYDDDADETTCTNTITMNIPTRGYPSLPSSSAASRVVPHQQQHSQQRNAIDHGRLLLRRLDSPITVTTSSNPL